MFLTSQGKFTRKIAVLYGMEILRGSISEKLQWTLFQGLEREKIPKFQRQKKLCINSQSCGMLKKSESNEWSYVNMTRKFFRVSKKTNKRLSSTGQDLEKK